MSGDAEKQFDLPDDEIAEAFAVLKQLQPSVDGRVLFRTTVAKELAALQATNTMTTPSGWKRVVSKLLPFAVGTSAGVVATLLFVSLTMNKATKHEGAPVLTPVITDEQNPSPSRSSEESDDDSPKYEIRVTETYLCGIGKVNSVSRFIAREKE